MKVMVLHPVGYENSQHLLQAFQGVGETDCYNTDPFLAIENEFLNQGHDVITSEHSDELDLLLFDSGFWWPSLEDEATSPYDQRVVSNVLRRRVPVAWFDPYDRSPGEIPWRWEDSLASEIDARPASANQHWYQFAHNLIHAHHPVLFFMRKMQNGRQYPPWVVPLEYPLFLDFAQDSKEDFLARPYDVCGIANLSFPRAMAFIGLLRSLGVRADCELRPSYRRIGCREFILRHRAARFFVEADASMGSERPMVLATVAAMLRITSPHRIPVPRADLVHQVEIGDHDGWIRDEDIEKLRRVLDDGDLCYAIYVQGAEFMRRHYSLDARAQYVMREIYSWLSGIGLKV